jgi:hypothetical protein
VKAVILRISGVLMRSVLVSGFMINWCVGGGGGFYRIWECERAEPALCGSELARIGRWFSDGLWIRWGERKKSELASACLIDREDWKWLRAGTRKI